MEIIHDDYQVKYDPDSSTVVCQGSFRLRGSAEYAPITEILMEAANAKPETMTLDLTGLQFLNSSGINTLTKMVIQIRKHKASKLVIQGSSQYPWQKKSLKNFQRLLPNMELEIT